MEKVLAELAICPKGLRPVVVIVQKLLSIVRCMMDTVWAAQSRQTENWAPVREDNRQLASRLRTRNTRDDRDR